MGAWGPGIFSDDDACDVREEYRGLIGDGVRPSEATDRLIRKWESELEDPDVGPVFWIALAATQWKLGRLEERVKRKALEVIASGSDLARWEQDPTSAKLRRKALDKLSSQLDLPQPPARQVAKPFRDSTDWKHGEVVAYRLGSGRWTLFRVIGFHSDEGGTAPVCELLDWTGDAPPAAAAEISGLGIRREASARGISQFLLSGFKGKLPEDRVRRLKWASRPAQKPGSYTAFFWRTLDSHLEEVFGLR